MAREKPTKKHAGSDPDGEQHDGDDAATSHGGQSPQQSANDNPGAGAAASGKKKKKKKKKSASDSGTASGKGKGKAPEDRVSRPAATSRAQGACSRGDHGGGSASSNPYDPLDDSDGEEEEGEVPAASTRRSPDNSPRALLEDIVANMRPNDNDGGGSSADPSSSLRSPGGALEAFLASALEEAYKKKEQPADWVLDLVTGTSNSQRKTITQVNPRRLETELSAENPPNSPLPSDDAPEVSGILALRDKQQQ